MMSTQASLSLRLFVTKPNETVLSSESGRSLKQPRGTENVMVYNVPVWSFTIITFNTENKNKNHLISELSRKDK